VEKAIKENRDKKATGDYAIRGKVLKLLRELIVGLKLMTWLINSIYVSRGWSRDFTEVTMIALKKKPRLQNAAIIVQSASSYTQQRQKKD
jgi:hypothetical protein